MAAMRRVLLVVPLVVGAGLLPGCFLDRAGFGSAREDGGPVDGRVPPRDARVEDARMEEDTGVPPRDGGRCDPAAPDLCNGFDDDCDPSSADGADEPGIGEPCDDARDADLCADGTQACIGGFLVCDGDDGDQPDEVELCNGLDDDCDPGTPDGMGDPSLGRPCDGGDSDRCEEGMWICDSGSMRCTDGSGDSIESCNGLDDDCDGSVDEGAGCPCTHRVNPNDGHGFIFCGGWGDQRSWTDARDWCRGGGRGYELARVDSRVEMRWIDQQLDDIAGNRRWWIGANDRVAEGTYAWTDGSSATYTNWRSGEPNNAGDEDCVHVDPQSDGGDTRGGWNDADCGLSDRFVCEGGP